MEEGFRMPNEYTAIGLDPEVSLVNSVICAEAPRITTFMKGGNTTSSRGFQTDSTANLQKIEHLPSGHILICKVFYPGSKYIAIETSKESPKKKTWRVNDPGLIMPEYLVEFEYNVDEKVPSDNTVTFETKFIQNKEINKMFAATIEAQKILQNTYLNPQVKEGVKGTSFHISAEDLDR